MIYFIQIKIKFYFFLFSFYIIHFTIEYFAFNTYFKTLLNFHNYLLRLLNIVLVFLVTYNNIQTFDKKLKLTDVINIVKKSVSFLFIYV